MSISSGGRNGGPLCKRVSRNEIQRPRKTSKNCYRKSSFCVSCFGPDSEFIVVEGLRATCDGGRRRLPSLVGLFWSGLCRLREGQDLRSAQISERIHHG